MGTNQITIENYPKHIVQWMQECENSNTTSGIDFSSIDVGDILAEVKFNYPLGASKSELDLLLVIIVMLKKIEAKSTLPKQLAEAILKEQRKAFKAHKERCLVCGHTPRKSITPERREHLQQISILHRKRPTPVLDAMRKLIHLDDIFTLEEALVKFKDVAAEATIRRNLVKMVKSGELSMDKHKRICQWSAVKKNPSKSDK